MKRQTLLLLVAATVGVLVIAFAGLPSGPPPAPRELSDEEASKIRAGNSLSTGNTNAGPSVRDGEAVVKPIGGGGKKEDKPPIGIGGETTGNRVAKPVQALPKRTQAPPPPPPITDDPHEAQVTQPVLLPVDPVASGETGGKGKSSSVKVIDEDDGVEGDDDEDKTPVDRREDNGVVSRDTKLEVEHGVLDPTDPNCFVMYNSAVDGKVQCAPHFFILGTFKSGTTSMYSYLARHPDVALMGQDFRDNRTILPRNKESRIVRYKEPGFFGVPKSSFSRYMQIFPEITPGEHIVTGEGSPGYIFAPAAPQKMLENQPNGRFIVLMREPIDRVVSRVQHMASLRPDADSSDEFIAEIIDMLVDVQLDDLKSCVDQFEDILADGVTPYVDAYANISTCWARLKKPPKDVKAVGAMDARGTRDEIRRRARERGEIQKNGNLGDDAREKEAEKAAIQADRAVRKWLSTALRMNPIAHSIYYYQILHWLEYFPREQFLFLQAEEFFGNTAAVMDEVTDFLRLPPIDWSDIVNQKFNVGRAEKRAGIGIVPEKTTITNHKVNEPTKTRLREFFSPLNAKLEAFLGRPLWDYVDDPADASGNVGGDERSG